MKDLSKLEEAYKPTKEEIDALILEKFIEVHHTVLEVAYVTTAYHSLCRMGIKSLQDLNEVDVNELVESGIFFGKTLRSILNLKDVLNKELSEGSPE